MTRVESEVKLNSVCNFCPARHLTTKGFRCNPNTFALRSNGNHYRQIPIDCPRNSHSTLKDKQDNTLDTKKRNLIQKLKQRKKVLALISITGFLIFFSIVILFFL